MRTKQEIIERKRQLTKNWCLELDDFFYDYFTNVVTYLMPKDAAPDSEWSWQGDSVGYTTISGEWRHFGDADSELEQSDDFVEWVFDELGLELDLDFYDIPADSIGGIFGDIQSQLDNLTIVKEGN